MIKTLLSIRLRSAFASMRGKKKDGTVGKPSTGKIILFAVLYLYLALVFLGLFTMLALSFAPMTVGVGLDAMYYGIFMLVGFSFVFIFSIFETKSELFDCKDNELLLAMPIHSRDIVVSRILIVLIYNYVEMAAVMLPAIIVYAVFGGSVIGVFGGIAVLLLMPLLATALASGVGYGVALLARRFKNNSFIITLASLIALLVYFVAYFGLMDSFEAMLEDESFVMTESPLLSAIGSVALLSPLPLLIFTVLSLGSAYLAWRVISAKYIAIATDNKGSARVEYKARRLERKSAFEAMTRKELRKFFSSSTYMLNSAMGVIFTVAIAVIALINRGSMLALVDELSASGINGRGMLSTLMIAALVMTGSMNMISACALSVEGKSLWVLKSMPISATTVLLAKCMPHVLVTTASTLVSAVLLMISCGAPVWYWPFFILTPTVTNILFALLGIALNVAFPKFEFDNEAQPVKQSLPVFLSMITGMLWGFIIIAISTVLSIFGLAIIAVIATFTVTSVAAAIMYAVVTGPCVRKYEKL